MEYKFSLRCRQPLLNKTVSTWCRFLFVMFAVIVFSGCAKSVDNATDQEINAEFEIKSPNDPFEDINRVMWSINYDYLDPYIARPVSLFYVNTVPDFARIGISNFINNLEEPSSMLNSLFMQENEEALVHFNRFWINSTFGIVGLLDIASAADIRIEAKPQFGDVLGYYGVGQGPYFMIPIYGPFILREGIGDLVDDIYPPLSLLSLPQEVLKWLFSSMESRAALVSREGLLENSLDPYIVARDAYLQNKAFKARGAKSETKQEEEEEFFDEQLLDEIDDY